MIVSMSSVIGQKIVDTCYGVLILYIDRWEHSEKPPIASPLIR